MSRMAEALARARKIGPLYPADEPLPWHFDQPEGLPVVTPAAEVIPLRHPPLRSEPAPARSETAPAAEVVSGFAGLPNLSAATLEQHGPVAAALHQQQQSRGFRTVMTASAWAGEGKTFVTAHLGVVLSTSYGRRVLLLDANLRRPALHSIFGVPNTTGVTDHLRADNTGRPPVRDLSPTLSILTAGTLVDDPLPVLTSDSMHRLVRESAEAYDWVLIDTPAVTVMPDADLMGSCTDAALLVVQVGRTPSNAVQRAVDALGRSRVVGTILNRFSPTSS
jgi:protein-tyrosine kinase